MRESLAIKLRPKSIKEVVGQKHLVGDNAIINNMIENNYLPSLIFYGRPGVGKTSLAHAIVSNLKLRHRFLNAVINNKKDFDVVVEEAKMYEGMVVIMDEIHRLNKDKQDLLLPYLESGLITLIGMTTSNPYHKINPAIRSRCQIFELKDLKVDEVISSLKKATCHLNEIKIDDESINYIANYSDGDLRSAYNLLETLYYSSSNYNINLDYIKTVTNKPILYADLDGDGHFDLLSAFQKSIRGSDVDASLHYLARLIEIGDFDSIYRRMTVIAYEDIGLANTSIGPKVDAAINACERIGMPEARIALANIVIELSLSPKSNSAYLALDMAIEDIKKGNVGVIPKHIKNTSKEYKYPFNYKNNFIKQQYLPDKLKNRRYYKPQDNKFESSLKNIILKTKGS